MPAGQVKTEQDEKDWGRAKHSCKKYKQGEKGGGRYWVCVSGTFQRIKKNRSKGS